MAVLLTATARAWDLPARLGGEEFVLLLANTTLDEAKVLCLRTRTLFHTRHDWSGVDGLQVTFRAAHKTTTLTARRARPVLGIGMYHAYTPVATPP